MDMGSDFGESRSSRGVSSRLTTLPDRPLAEVLFDLDAKLRQPRPALRGQLRIQRLPDPARDQLSCRLLDGEQNALVTGRPSGDCGGGLRSR